MKTIANRIFAPEPGNTLSNAALLVLRLWLGLSMFFLHGLDKLINFGDKSSKFPDLLGLGSTGSLTLAVFAEVFCSAMLVLGLVTRFAAFNLCATMLVAYAVVHKLALSGSNSGELAFIYLAGYVVLLIAGPGRYSADACLFAKPPRFTNAG
ncbi:MAG: DoxX family protein [Verrucomicrobia bacterium]|nr:DoxX family protein [Verrucomicrobiota bacterium]